jgi:DNA-binding response OmpR family regulator/DNA-binding CsgD family transcriptional regulator
MTGSDPDARCRDIVLVVDDSPETVGMLTSALEAAGITVLVALDGHRALSLVDRVTPDLILMDAMMPGLDGFETCRRLKQAKRIEAPVIFMTGLSETEHILRGFESGGVDYVTKPIITDELIARMRTHLGNARTTLSARSALDATGRFLLAVDGDGGMLWLTPQARQILTADAGDLQRAAEILRAEVPKGTITPQGLSVDFSGRRLVFTLVGAAGDEILLRIFETRSVDAGDRLRQSFGLTPKEAEVLLWLAKGKSNRDIAEILSQRPRTVNKHLEQIFQKLGVENRTAAAARALALMSEEGLP